jgi:hypothetical protein
LQNLRKHGIRLAGPDPYSSGPQFDGWMGGRQPAAVSEAAASDATARDATAGRARLGGDSAARLEPLRRAMRAATAGAKTWLLGVGWTRYGLIDPGEAPRSR